MIFIPRGAKQKVSTSLSIGKKVTIEVQDYVIHPFEGYVVHEQWNNGVAPTDKVMEVIILQFMGQMVKVHSKNWEGWLSRKSFEVVGE